MTKWVYSFGPEKTEGRGAMKNLLGGKGANLAEMAFLGLPVPPGFTITTEVCTYFYENGRTYPADLAAQVDEALAAVESADGPSVRRRRQSAAGLGALRRARLDAGHDGHRAQPRPQRRVGRRPSPRPPATSASPTTATAASSRCIRTSCSSSTTTRSRRSSRSHEGQARAYTLDTDLSAADWREIIVAYKAAVQKETGKPFPQDPREQLWGAIGAVFGSWMNARAITYRRLNDIPADWGTAVNVQAMVFGNMGETSATGVAFTRNPSTGENKLYGEFLVNAQGEDVVAGIRTPQNITEAARKAAGSDKPSLETVMPAVFKRVRRDDEAAREALPRHAGHRVHRRARQAVDAADPQRQAHRARPRCASPSRWPTRGCITKRRGDPPRRAGDARPAAAPDHRSRAPSATSLATGLPASPGAACGEIVFTADEAEALQARPATR